ncbi:MAG: glycosyltransferase family 2 protein, partial [Flavobacteriaceae bacterium]
MTYAVVILNWNGKALLEKFLPALVKHSSEANLYVIDNASSDDSLHFLSEHYPEVSQIALSDNFGFAKGYNEGLKQVKEQVW